MYNFRELCERVIKDYDIPIYFIDEQQFLSVLESVDMYGRFEDIFKIAHNYLTDNDKNVDDFSRDIRTVTESIITYIKERPRYHEFCDTDFSRAPFETEILGKRYSKCLDIYIQPNAGKEFISIDLTHANEQTLILCGVTDCTFHDLVSLFTEDKNLIEYIANSKHLRQVVYGNTCPKQQALMERFMTERIVRYLSTIGVKKEDLVGYTTDEIILRYTDHTFGIASNRFSFIETIKENLGYRVHVDLFRLVRLEPHAFYVKEHVTRPPKFKNIPKKYFPQAVKRYLNKQVTENDLRFMLDSDAVRFEKPLW